MTFLARRNGRFRFLAAVFILLTAAVSLYGKGAREDNALSRADELIANKEYDEAIRLLTDYMKGNPDDFSEAQSRFQQIVRLRGEYNDIADDLLDVLETEPENSERILELSDKLLAIESASNPATRRFLDQIRYVAGLQANRNRLEGLLLAGRERLERNDFSGALDVYASGLDIYRDSFFEAGYGQDAEDAAASGLQAISRNIEDFDALMGRFNRAAEAVAVLDGPSIPAFEDLSAAFQALSPPADELAGLKESFIGVRDSFAAQLELLRAADDTLGDRSFLSFAGWLISGPVGRNEGMAGAVDRFWRAGIAPAEQALADIAARSYGESYEAMLNGDYSGALAGFDRAARYIAPALALTADWNRFLLSGGGESRSVYGETVGAEKSGDYLKFRAMEKALGYLREAGTIAARGQTLETGASPALDSWREGLLEAGQAVSEEQEIRDFCRSLAGDLRSLGERLETEIEEFRGYREIAAAAASGTGDYLADARNAALDLERRFQTAERESAVRLYTVASGDLEKRTNERAAEFAEGEALIQGVPREMEGIGAYTAYYPTEGVSVLSGLNQNFDADIQSARTLVARYNEEPQAALADSRINALFISAQRSLSRLLDLQSRSAGMLASARIQMERAASLTFEGDRLLQAAQAALARNDFTGARSNLARAAEQYNASLAIQESSALREIWEARVMPLGADIIRVENEVVVRDVRNLLTTARARYYAGNMEQAEEVLVRAQNRWRVTNVTEQAEVEYWLRLVRGAMSLQSGRTISPTAPLYAEMSQLLSDAKGNYDEGVRLIGSGRRTEGLAKFGEAAGKTREVRLIFPMNQEARLIELRIEQQTDASVFNASFRQRLNEAVAGTKARNTESFAELQDLAGINPRYPGIQALINQAEIDMGLRPPPPDPRALARSTELARNAQTIIDARDTIRYELAQTYLRDAIGLNPNNASAQTLMDQLQIRMTGTGVIVLSSYAQERYNAALQEFLRGNFLSANAIVEQLLQNSESRRSTLIQDLKRRIDAVL